MSDSNIGVCCFIVFSVDCNSEMCVPSMQVCNLMLAARATHVWYKHKFEDYPAGRYALIPFVF